MDAIEMLEADHQKVKELFEAYEAAGQRAYQKKRSIAEKIFMEITVHSTLEEELFYPAMRQQANKDGKQLVAESIEEHHVVATLIDEMQELDAQDERFEAKFSVLKEHIEHHIEEEEYELFPEAEELLDDSLEALGAQMEERREQLLAALG
jgi:hemerythrin-like domain-containing protein